jgi:RNA polymerase sigma-70 factor (ECF subfamily)
MKPQDENRLSENKPMRMTPVESPNLTPGWVAGASGTQAQEFLDTRARKPDDLVRLFSADIWKFTASQITKKEDAEDIVMEVFAVAFSDFSKVQRADDQRVWLLAIARRKVADHLRRKYRRAEQPLSAESVEAAPMLTEMQIATRGALDQIPENEREALVLKYVNGLSTEEVGMVIRRSIAATNSLLQRARESLRQALGPQVLGNSGEVR